MILPFPLNFQCVNLTDEGSKRIKEGHMKIFCRSVVVASIFSMVFSFLGCGGATGGGGAGGGPGTSSDPVALKTVKAVDADLSKLDLAKSGASSSVKAPKSSAKGIGSSVGDDSIAGCVSRQLVDEAIRLSKEVSLFQCYMGAMQDNFSEFVLPDGSLAYYAVSLSAGKAGPSGEGFSLKIRTGKNVSSANSLDVDLCEGGVQTEAFDLSSNASTRAITFAVKHHFSSATTPEEANDEFCDFDNSGVVSDEERVKCRSQGSFDEWMSLNGSVVAKSTATGSIDSVNEISSAEIVGKFDGNFGKGNLNFMYDEDGSPNAGPVNVVSGGMEPSFGIGDSGTDFIYSELDDDEGSAKYSASGSFPGVPSQFLPSHFTAGTYCPVDNCDPGSKFQEAACRVLRPAASCYCMQLSTTGSCSFNESGTEHFGIAKDSGGNLKFTVAVTSVFATSVAAAKLASSVQAVEKSFGSGAWDCSVPSGSTLVTINIPDESIFNTCFAIEEEAFANTDHDSCFQDEGEGQVQEGKTEAAKIQ